MVQLAGRTVQGCTWQQRPQSWLMYTENLIELGYDGDTRNMTNTRTYDPFEDNPER
jgi:hypothetical protein